MKRGGGSDHLAHSLTDLMISLMVIFILLLLVFLNNQACVSSAATHSLQAEMKRQLEPAGFQNMHLDRRDPFTIVVAIPPDLMTFEPNSRELKPQGQAFLHSKMPKLVQLLCDSRYREKVESVIAEGYADNAPFRGASPEESRSRNFKLSQDRAWVVAKTSLAALAGDPAAQGCFLEKLSASGRGAQDLESTAAENRRVVLKIRMSFGQGTEALQTIGSKEEPPPAPPVTPGVLKIMDLLERLRANQEHVTFELTEAEINEYISFTLHNTRRPGIEQLIVKIFPHNYVSTVTLVDFDALERWSPGTLPVYLRSILNGRTTIWIDYRFDVHDGKAQFSIEKAFYDQTPLPSTLVRKIIQVLAALQPEHMDTEQPVPLPFGIRRLQTGNHVLSAER